MEKETLSIVLGELMMKFIGIAKIMNKCSFASTVCHIDGPMDNSGVRLLKESMVAFHILLGNFLMCNNAGCAKVSDETSFWHYSQVNLKFCKFKQHFMASNTTQINIATQFISFHISD